MLIKSEQNDEKLAFYYLLCLVACILYCVLFSVIFYIFNNS